MGVIGLPARLAARVVGRVGALPGYAARVRAVPRLGLATVHGRSMEPTLHEGDRLVVLWGLPPVRGRLALVRLPDAPHRPIAVKRVMGPDPNDGRRWWVERDNPREGVDSWQVGGIPDEDVAALVVARLPQAPALGRSLRGVRRGRFGASEN
ncbi:MAG: S26 family signal peptidase [Actinomycetales bacterium]|nr:S26 family signal peptidase [Actinomycetales bacterium]